MSRQWMGYTYTEKLFVHYHLWDSNVTGCPEFFICQIWQPYQEPFCSMWKWCGVKQCGSLLFRPEEEGRPPSLMLGDCALRLQVYLPSSLCWSPTKLLDSRTVPSGESWLLSLPWPDTQRLIIRGQTVTVLDFILYSITHPGKPSRLDLQKEGI